MKRITLFFDSKLFFYCLAALTFCLITLTAIIFKQSPIRLLPFYVSIFVRILHSRANRFGHLIGGFNAVLYGFVYMHYRLYGMMFYSFAFSFPLQVTTFLSWTIRAYGSSAAFRQLSWKLRGAAAVCGIAAYLGYVFFAQDTDASFVYLDSAITVLGIMSSTLTLFVCREYAYTSITHNALSVLLYFMMTLQTPETSTYLVFGIYALTCSARQFASVRRLWEKQLCERQADCAAA